MQYNKTDLLIFANHTTFHKDMLYHATKSYIEHRKNKTLLVYYDSKCDDYIYGFEDIENVKVIKIKSSNDVLTVCTSFDISNVIYMFGLINGDRLTYTNQLKSEPLSHKLDLIFSLLNTFYDKPFYHFMLDPQEVDILDVLGLHHIKNETHFIHDLSDRDNVIVNPFIVYPFLHNDNDIFKTYDFVFGLTAFNDKYRSNIIKHISVNLTDSSKFYYCEIVNDVKIDTRIPYDQYLKQVALSKTTLVVPSYDVSTFSIHRFVESIANGCIPIVDSNCNLDVLDHELSMFIQLHLLIDFDIDNINHFIQNICLNYDQILSDIVKLSYIKNLLTDEQTYLKPIKQLICLD